MTKPNYKAVLRMALNEYHELIEKREELDIQIAWKNQFIRATLHMLDLNEDDESEFSAIEGVFETRHFGLTNAVRQTLQSSKEWFTATQMRDALQSTGFDFDHYRANPLASIHSVMKRLKDSEAERTEIEGVMAWRWKGVRRFPRRKK